MFSRPFPLGDNRGSSHIANLTNLVNSHTIYGGKGISVVHQHDGIVISNTTAQKRDTICYRDLYAFGSEYFPFDAVYVDSATQYFDQTGSVITIPSGFYLALQYIPPANNDSTYFLGTIVPSYSAAGGAPTDIDANAYRWYLHNVYYPRTDYSGSESTVADSGYNIQTNIKYWQFLGGGTSVSYMIYDENAAIPANTFVWVEPTAHYSRSFFDTGSGNAPPLCAGCFFTKYPIPAPISGTRPSGNYWFPFYPTFDHSASVTVSGSVFNQIKFEPITPLSPQTFCTANGGTYSGFGMFIITGSDGGFHFSLPYTP